MIEQAPTFVTSPEADKEAILRLRNVRLVEDRKSLWYCKRCGTALRYRSYELITETLKAHLDGHECLNELCSPTLPERFCQECGKAECICGSPDVATTEEFGLNVRLNKESDELFDAVFKPKPN